jgi:hypothetical protein
MWWRARRLSYAPARVAPSPVRLLATISVLSAVMIAAYRVVFVWTMLQRQYLLTYVRTDIPFLTDGSYALWHVVTAKGRRLAAEDDVVSVTTPAGETSLRLSDQTHAAGATGLVFEVARYPDMALHEFLFRWIYREHALIDLAAPSLWGALAVFLGGLLGAAWREIQEVLRGRRAVPADTLGASWDAPRAPTTSPQALVPVTTPSRSPTGPVGSASPVPAPRASSQTPEWWSTPVLK